MKKRLDALIVEIGLISAREKAKEAITNGQIFVNGKQITKSSFEATFDDNIEFVGEKLKYVSRGGLKLEKAIKAFNLKLDKCVCCDFGASTGGFTDCMLQNGATKIYAVDVGCEQLAEKLKNDKRVINMEKTNIRYITKNDIPSEIDFISVDVSFISLKLILPIVFMLLKNTGSCVCLIKPQFEAGKEKIGKKGVVKDIDTHLEVINNTAAEAIRLGFIIAGLDYSPIKGPEGNIEYLLYLKKQGESQITLSLIMDIVKNSHNTNSF